MPEITEKFINGLKNYQLTREEVAGWIYCGGNKGARRKYFHQIWGNDMKIPHVKNKCICGHPIQENCYITGEQPDKWSPTHLDRLEYPSRYPLPILILGNCCVKRFITEPGKTCELCYKSHRNRVVNRCNECREGRCDDCGGPAYYRKCDGCRRT